MITLFASPKPFRGRISIIQHNAITSWKLLRPKPEVILFGDEEGTAEVCRALDLKHVPQVARNEFGTPLTSDLFQRARQLAANDVLCYVNADIILMSDFLDALDRVARWRSRILMVGRRWDLSVEGPIDFSRSDWEGQLRSLALQQGKPRPAQYVDYFAFSRQADLGIVPPFAVGRPGWDNWVLWRASTLGVAVVDASRVVMAVHQNHDYSHHPQGEAGVYWGEEARRNRELMGSRRHFRTIDDTAYVLTPSRIRPNYRRWLVKARRIASRPWSLLQR